MYNEQLKQLDGFEELVIMRFLFLLVGSAIIVLAFNFFLIPHKILSSGLSGISMILGLITPINTGLVNLILNLPLLALGFVKLGRNFFGNTIVSVMTISVLLYLVPVYELVHVKMLSSIFGGALTGLGVGIIFRCSGSTGGLDIIGMIMSRKKDFPLGTLLSGMNGIVILASGFIFDWDSALYTLLSIFVTGKVVDAVYTHHVKLTLMIITDKGEEMQNHFISNIYRGLTVLNAVGGYSNQERCVLLYVISKYELAEVKKLISDVDPNAFVNITQTIEVLGLFHKPSIGGPI